jgi:transposase
MSDKTSTQNNDTNKIPVEQLISSKDIESAFEVGRRTVRRWAKQYNWREYRFSHKVLRYLRNDVENSMGVSFANTIEG